MFNEIPTNRSVSKYRERTNDKGQIELVPIYLHETPDDEIKRENELFTEWKSTKQIKYDKDGMRLTK